VVAGHADWAGEILRMTMASTHAGTDPDYAISAAILTYLIDMVGAFVGCMSLVGT